MSILIFLWILLGSILGLTLKMRTDMIGWKGFEVTEIGPRQKGFTVANWKRENSCLFFRHYWKELDWKSFPCPSWSFFKSCLILFSGLMLKMRPDMVGWKGFEVTEIGPRQKGFTVANWKREKFGMCTPVAIPPPIHSTLLWLCLPIHPLLRLHLPLPVQLWLISKTLLK